MVLIEFSATYLLRPFCSGGRRRRRGRGRAGAPRRRGLCSTKGKGKVSFLPLSSRNFFCACSLAYNYCSVFSLNACKLRQTQQPACQPVPMVRGTQRLAAQRRLSEHCLHLNFSLVGGPRQANKIAVLVHSLAGHHTLKQACQRASISGLCHCPRDQELEEAQSKAAPPRPQHLTPSTRKCKRGLTAFFSPVFLRNDVRSILALSVFV